MNEREIAAALESKAAQMIPDTVDVWPGVEAQVQRGARRTSWSPLRLAVAGVVVVALVSLGAARLHALRRTAPTPAAAADQPVSSASWVTPEVFPDLATLLAATDLTVRGRAMGPGELAIEEILLNRLGVDPAQAELRLIQVPPDAPALLNDPPLVPGEEYILFLRSFYGAGSEHFEQGDRSFRPVGGAQGQWLVRDGRVVQSADVPLKARSGEPVDAFVGGIVAAPDLRGLAGALLARYGWAVGEPDTVRLQALATAEAIACGADAQAWVAASRAIGLDWAPHAGQPALYLHYLLDPRGLTATVLVAEGRPIGAFLRAGEWGLVFALDQREAALAALADPGLRPTPTPDPNPLGARPNLAQHYRLAQAQDMWVKGLPVEGGLLHDPALQARLVAALDTAVAVRRLGVGEVPADDADTVLVVFDLGGGEEMQEGDRVAFRYHVDEGRVYIHERGVVFDVPPGFAEALAPILGPAPTAAPGKRPTEAPVPPMVSY